MILTCPACATQYRLKDGAIPPEGRQVRCAACKHKWHEDGPSDTAPSDGEQGAAGHWPLSSEPVAQSISDGIAGGPPQADPQQADAPTGAVPPAAADEQMIAETPEPEVPAGDANRRFAPVLPQAPMPKPAMTEMGAEDDYASDPYPAEEEHGFVAIPAMHDEDEPRGGNKWAWILGIVLIVVAAAAAFYFFAPAEMKARAGIAEAGESPLELMLTTSDRQKLASGNELLAISGRVINSTDREQAVPPILAELRNPANNQLVYQWTIAPPARSLAPGAAASFNSAEVDVPEGGDNLSLRFAS